MPSRIDNLRRLLADRHGYSEEAIEDVELGVPLCPICHESMRCPHIDHNVPSPNGSTRCVDLETDLVWFIPF